MIILIRPDGKGVEVDDKIYEAQLIRQGFKYANEIQTSEYILENYGGTIDYNNIRFVSSIGNADGYGMSSENMRDEFIKRKIFLSETSRGQKIGLLYAYPSRLDALQTQVKLIYSMFESTKIPKQWIDYCKRADRIFVPSKFCQDAFLTRGVETEVIPLGYNQKNFFYEESMEKDPNIFTFLHYDAFNTRKGWDLLFKAFTEEFKSDKSVKLILKTTKDTLPFPILASEYPNIQVIKQKLPQYELRKLIAQSDCFVFPSRGEGFGLTPVEALACGTPSIIPSGSGMSEYFNPNFFIDVEYYPMPCFYENPEFAPSNCGEMIEVKISDLRTKLRYAYNNRDLLKDMGIKGAEWISQKYTMTNTVDKLEKVIKEYL